jgi:ABC-type transport system substrate-binding protein
MSLNRHHPLGRQALRALGTCLSLSLLWLVATGAVGTSAFAASAATSEAASSATSSANAATNAAANAPAKVLRYAFRVAETGFDPVKVSDLYSHIVLANIFEGLYEYDHLARPPLIKPRTALALPEVSADYKVFVIRIQPGIYFADDPAFAGKRRASSALPTRPTRARSGAIWRRLTSSAWRRCAKKR